VVPSRAYLEKIAANGKDFDSMVIPRPKHWGGYLVVQS
jgi:pyridoxamine 5'-phosphate oxidase